MSNNSNGPVNFAEDASGAVKSSILDTILGAEQLNQLQNFDPQAILSQMFGAIDERAQYILKRRYGLEKYEQATLEAIGQELKLTRERIRQVEKESIRKLREKARHHQLVAAHQLLTNVLNEHGSVMHEDDLVSTLLLSGRTPEQEAAVLFLLELEESFEKLRHEDYHPSWYLKGFDLTLLHKIIEEIVGVLDEVSNPLAEDMLLERLKEREHYRKNAHFYKDKTLKNYISISKK